MAIGCGGDPAPAVDPLDATYPNRRTSFEQEGRLLGYVANRRSDDVSVLDLDAMVELAAVPVGRDPVDDDGPRHVLLERSSGALLVLLSYPVLADSPHALANGTGPRPGFVVALASDDLRPLDEHRLEASPSELSLSDDGSVLAVVHYDTVRALANTPDIEQRRATLGLLAPAAGIVDGTAKLTLVPVCVAPASVVFAGNAGLAFVACTGEDSLVVVDTASRSVVSRVPAGSSVANQPYALTRSPAGATLSLSNRVARTVVLFEAAATPRALATVRVDGVPFFSTWLSETQLLVPMQGPGGLVRVDATSGQVVQTVTYPDSVCMNPSEVKLARDGRLFLVCEGDHYGPGAVVRLDSASLEVVQTAKVGLYPDRLELFEP